MRASLQKWRSLAAAAGICVLGLLAYVLISGLLAPDLPATPVQNQITMRGVVGQGQSGGRVGWKFSADSSDVSPDGSLLTYHRVRATYYRGTRPVYVLTASQLVLDMRNQNYTASGGVRVRTASPDAKLQSLATDEVLWSNAVATLTCPATVEMRYGGSGLQTSRLAVNFNSGQTTFGKTALKL
ncbi:MAG: LPS export ABC transporter periplasmic protein LptC [Candidatus Eremiobacteraeota bacterium]|nr:LPS export ABC transporter periplasmic protein LptC [Candidatus Eremiobacteraeota bacterium]MBC5826259.1 LPS export ABC transporter periplasmic protein LptC [Candidatus Eremiobacteraeota bacterium]